MISKFVLTIALLAVCQVAVAAESDGGPNIVFILADDLGYGDVGCYGQRVIKTPNIDRLAAGGLRFTQCYAGSTVCAPSRCALMTGLHTGHGRVRGNGLVPLQPEDTTVAEVLEQAGYATGIFGKWGLGEPGTTGVPNRKGFDEWFGYLNQVHAHNYYPDYLWKNEDKFPLRNVVRAGVATKRVEYSPDLCTEKALEFLEHHKAERFFLYLAYTLPHANDEAGKQGMEVPSDEPYSREPWPQPQKNHAAMITRLDTYVGQVVEKLAALGLQQNTVVFFTSDNGPHMEGGADPEFFHSSGPLRGYKRALYEGGIRVPMIVGWPKHVPAGETSAQMWAFWDVLPTLAELAGAKAPAGIDGISIVPTLLPSADRKQAQHDFFYWEFFEKGFHQAIRMGPWKGVKPASGPLELYDLDTDLGEKHNVAGAHPDVLKKMEERLKSARRESPDWPTGLAH